VNKQGEETNKEGGGMKIFKQFKVTGVYSKQVLHQIQFNGIF
jgi:hypothetical protein